VSNEIYLQDDEPYIVEKMVDFLYTTEYGNHRAAGDWTFKMESDTTIGLHDLQDMPAQVPALPDPSQEETVEYAEHDNLTEDSAVSILEYNPLSLVTNVKAYIIADKNEIKALKKLASTKYQQVVLKSWNSPAFAESALLVYENTMESDRAIRDVIVQTASDNVKALLDRGEFIEFLNSHGELATEILKKLVVSGNLINGFHVNFDVPSEFSIYGKEKKKEMSTY
jgi:hypothetical protein